MKKKMVLSVLMGVSLIVMGCERDQAMPEEQPVIVEAPAQQEGATPAAKIPQPKPIPRPDTGPDVEPPGPKPLRLSVDRETFDAVVKGNNQFALALYGRLAEKQGNLFFSPASLSTALAMTYAGAAGTTRTQMAEVLHFPVDGEPLHGSFEALLQVLNEQAPGCRLQVANRLWGQQGFAFRSEYLQSTRESYGAELAQVDFRGDAEGVRKTINEWVEGKTGGKITDLLAPGTLHSLTRLVLTNAIYFKGDWDNQFKKEATRREPFFLSDDEQVEVSLMRQRRSFKYSEDAQVQVLELPYVGKALAMVVVLPREREGLAQLEEALTLDKLEGWLNRLMKREVQVFLPRFKMETGFSLKSTLESMGMKEAFSEEADFSRMVEAAGVMTDEDRLLISDVIHKAFVEVNEEGTEAAAATGVVMDVLATSAPMPPVVFRADHPFLFLIRDSRTGSILFLGRVSNPA